MILTALHLHLIISQFNNDFDRICYSRNSDLVKESGRARFTQNLLQGPGRCLNPVAHFQITP